MNNSKIAFIICSNNELFIDECQHYLNNLTIPDGIEVELQILIGEQSMTSAYNKAESLTDAKYKVYMHQDVFIINRNFISDVISIFESDSNIGMIGMIGYEVASITGCMWEEEAYGSFPMYGNRFYSHYKSKKYVYSLECDGIKDVALVDGFMMITSKDLSWDEEFSDWDFYDASQSLIYLLNGYRVVVPTQRLPWAIHDDGFALDLFNYEKNRQLFKRKYGQFLGKKYDKIRKM